MAEANENSLQNKVKVQELKNKHISSSEKNLFKKKNLTLDNIEEIDESSREMSQEKVNLCSSFSRNLSLSDFEEINEEGKSLLGKGSYGTVKLVKYLANGKLYAMKIISKKAIFDYSSVENLKLEIKIQRKMNHPHITQLFTFFEDKTNVYLILEYAENGSLFNYLKKKGKFLEKEAFVFFFQTCLGINFLHSHRILHRDLKPENLLLDRKGNIKLCDFGWSAELSTNKTRTTFCGTIDYMAPEMLKNQPYDAAVDIWGLGVLLYELLHGFPPFLGKTNREKCANILTNQKFKFDENLSPSVRDLIENILLANPLERLTMLDIFNHKWTRSFESVYNIKIEEYVNIKKLKEEKRMQPFSNEKGRLNGAVTTPLFGVSLEDKRFFENKSKLNAVNLMKSKTLLDSPNSKTTPKAFDERRHLDFDYASLLNNSTSTGSRASGDRNSEREDKKRSIIEKSKPAKIEPQGDWFSRLFGFTCCARTEQQPKK